jgi:hypothetical protein
MQVRRGRTEFVPFVIAITAKINLPGKLLPRRRGIVRAERKDGSTEMYAQETSAVRELTTEEMDSVTGGSVLAVAGGVALGIATNALYDWLKAPGNVKAWESHLQSIL